MDINNIHCLALNYQGVGQSSEDPIYFLKSKSALSFDQSEIPYPKFDTSAVWTEVELGIVIAEDCENAEESSADSYIGGFFVAGDITCSSKYNRDHHLAFSKSRAGFCPIGRDIVKLNLHNNKLTLRTYINGKLRQEGSTQDMIFNPYKAVSYLSKIITLRKGDIILTGTPTTVNGGPQYDCLVYPGDEIVHTIESIGELSYKFGV
jgi:2-keto-4-pentenoate hydratase/2-oxohepta-3-ene-1,7-dioic acid hydratase in catechol pathway